jgi:tetratricopeptide (TPR) repeat protein
MKRFHKEANIDALWQAAQPAFEEVIARYHEPVVRTILEVNGYLRTAGIGYSGHNFQIYLDLLGAPNQIHVRRYKDDYFVVITPSPEPQINDIRHAYLHFMIEPLAARHAEEIEKRKALGDYALASPILEEYYKKDFLLLATKSLVKAAESRLAPPTRRAAMVEQALREGFILTPHFAEQLAAYEKQEQAMRFYFPELITSIDLKKEEQRLENVEFASARLVRKAKPAAATLPDLSGPQKTLEQAEELYRQRKLDEAAEVYRRLVGETEEKPLQAQAYYGLARIAALRNDPDLAEKLFLRTLELDPPPQVRSWTYVYLGRLADIAGLREQAERHYQAALATDGASAAAREAAEKGLKQSFNDKK